MFDLWLSITIHLFSLYEKRKAELLADSSSEIARRAQATTLRENWTHFSTSPIRSSTTSTTAPTFFSLRPINFSSRSGSHVFSQNVAASTPQRRSEPSHSRTIDGDDQKDTKNNGTARVVGGALSPKPPTVGGNNSPRRGKGVIIPTEISSVGMMHHALPQPSPRSGRVYRTARSPVDADRFQTIEQIVAKTQEILAMSASKARERKKLNDADVGVDGQAQNNLFSERPGCLAFEVVESSTPTALDKYRYKNRSELEKAEEMLRNEEHNRLPPLVQKVGLSLLEKERTIADINEGNRRFLQSVTTISTSSSSGRGGSERKITALRGESDSNNASLPSGKGSTSGQESRDIKNDLVCANEVCSTENRKEVRDLPLSQPDSRWDKMKSDVAAELEALFDRKYMSNQYRGHCSSNSNVYAGLHRGNEVNSNFDIAKRFAAAPEVDFEAAKERSRNAGKVADQTVEANKVFEALVVTKERERLERLRSHVDN